MAEPKSPVLEGKQAAEIVYAKDQPQYRALPVLRKEDGTVLMRVEFTEDERDVIVGGFDLFIEVSTFNHPLQPMRFVVGSKHSGVNCSADEIGEGY